MPSTTMMYPKPKPTLQEVLRGIQSHEVNRSLKGPTDPAVRKEAREKRKQQFAKEREERERQERMVREKGPRFAQNSERARKAAETKRKNKEAAAAAVAAAAAAAAGTGNSPGSVDLEEGEIDTSSGSQASCREGKRPSEPQPQPATNTSQQASGTDNASRKRRKATKSPPERIDFGDPDDEGDDYNDAVIDLTRDDTPPPPVARPVKSLTASPSLSRPLATLKKLPIWAEKAALAKKADANRVSSPPEKATPPTPLPPPVARPVKSLTASPSLNRPLATLKKLPIWAEKAALAKKADANRVSSPPEKATLPAPLPPPPAAADTASHKRKHTPDEKPTEEPACKRRVPFPVPTTTNSSWPPRQFKGKGKGNLSAATISTTQRFTGKGKGNLSGFAQPSHHPQPTRFTGKGKENLIIAQPSPAPAPLAPAQPSGPPKKYPSATKPTYVAPGSIQDFAFLSVPTRGRSTQARLTDRERVLAPFLVRGRQRDPKVRLGRKRWKRVFVR